ncbi:DNA adenine methylase [Mycoplasma sp. 128]
MNYIGSKLSLLSFIENTIQHYIKDTNNSFCDIFAGTGSVSKYFKSKGYRVIANDLQYYSYVRLKHFIDNNDNLFFSGLKSYSIEPFEYLNSLAGIKGFIYNNYCPDGTRDSEFQRMYFTNENVAKIDAVRTTIEQWKTRKIITDNEYYFLLASLLESADKVANTASVYESYLKKFKKSALKPLVLKPVDIVKSNANNHHSVFNKDANVLIKEISGDILYLDPPYNTRKYNTNYHILETIALYDGPLLKGKGGYRIESNKGSLYSSKKQALLALSELIKDAKFKYIFLSYNDEGIISIVDIKNLFKKYGRYNFFTHEYKRFKADKDANRNYKKTKVVEYIHCLVKNDF